jgi:hypothetical protein
MTTKSATSVAFNKPSDKLVAVDARKPTTTQALAKTPANQNGFLDRAITATRESKLNAKDLGNIVSIKDGKLGIDNKTAGSRIDSIAGSNITGILTSDNMDVRGRAAQNLAKILGNEEVTSITTQSGKVINIGRGVDTGSVKSLTGAIGKLLNVPALNDFVDQNSYLATGRALLEAAIILGVPEMIDELKTKFEKDQDSRHRLINGVKGVILRSDLAMLDKIIEWIGVDGVLAKVPDAVQLLLAAYAFPPQTTPDNYPECKTTLINMLNRLKPEWWLTTRNGVKVLNYTMFTRISYNAATLLKLDVVDELRGPTAELNNLYLVPILAAPNFRFMEMSELALKQYPRLGLWR